MKDNLYKFLKFLNRNKYIAFLFVFAASFFAFKNIVFAASCSMTNIGACFDEIVGGILTSIALFFISFSSYLFGLAFPVFLNITGWLLNSGPINTAWILVRDLVNMFFIFFLLFTSLAKLVGQEKKLAQHSASKQIVYILLSAFLINFSKVICGVVVDIAQIVTLQFTNAFIDSLQNLNSLFDVSIGTNPTILLGIIFVVFALAFLATALTSLLYILIRAVSLGIYAALSPLWFLWLSFPTKAKGIEQIKEETMDKFFEAAIGGPILAFYLWISLMLINTGSDGSLTDSVNNAGSGPKSSNYVSSGTQSGEAMSTVSSGDNGATILKMIVASAVLLFANKQAMSMAKKGGKVMGHNVMDGVVNKVGDIGMKPLNGLKDMGMKTAKGVGNLASKPFNAASEGIQAGMFNARNTLKGGVMNGIDKLRQKPKGFGAGLNTVMGWSEGMKGNAEKRAAFVAEEKKLRKDAANGDSKALAKLREHQKEKGKLVASEMRQAGGAGKFLAGGLKKYSGVAAVTGAAVAIGSGIERKKDGKSFFATEQEKSIKNIDELKKKKEEMENNKQKYTKDDIAVIDQKIKNEENKQNEANQKKKLAEDEKEFGVAKSARREFDRLSNKKASIQNRKSENEKNISDLTDRNSEIDQQLKNIPRGETVGEVQENQRLRERLISEKKANQKNIEKSSNQISKDSERLSEFNRFHGNRTSELEDSLSRHMTLDDVLKQESAYGKSKKTTAESYGDIVKAINKSAGISEKKENSNSLQKFKDEMSNVGSSLIDLTTGKVKDGASIDFTTMVRDLQDKNGKSKLSVRGNENEFLASLAFAIQNGIDTKDQKSLIEDANIQSELSSYINSGRVDKDFKEEWRKITDKNKSGISLPQAKIRTEENNAEERERILNIAKNNGNPSIKDQEEEVSENIREMEGNSNGSAQAVGKVKERTEKETRVEHTSEYIKAKEELAKMEDEMTNPKTSKADTKAYEELVAEVERNIANTQAHVSSGSISNSPIEVSQDSFTSISRAIKGAVKDLDSSLSSKFDQLIDSIGESTANGGNSEFALSRESISSLASELHSGMTPDQYNSLAASLNNISSGNQEVKTAIGEVVKALQQQANIQETKDKQQEADNIRNAGTRENDSRPQYLRTQKDDHDNGLS